MFQKFNTDTLVSRFIKNLLTYSEVPLLDIVHEGDYIIKDCLYIYNHFVIKCISSGFIGDDSSRLFPSNVLYPLDVQFPNRKHPLATYKVVNHYTKEGSSQFTEKYVSSTSWYDKDTHKYLGNYLRYLRDHWGLNLMPFYNCYGSFQLEDVYLNEVGMKKLYPNETIYPHVDQYPGVHRFEKNYEIGYQTKYRVMAVPIKFNTLYTIAIECPYLVQMRSIIYDKYGMVKNGHDPVNQSYYSDNEQLEKSFVQMTNTQFRKPFTYIVQTDDKDLYLHQKNLYLIIQVPKSCLSALTVLEGDYTDSDNQKYKNLSLLLCNTNVSYAFSDRLVEYLLQNVINPLDQFSTNVKYVQRLISQHDEEYNSLVSTGNVSLGVWDNDINDSVRRIVDKYSSVKYIVDQDGNVNKDFECLCTDMLKRRIE